MEAADITLHQAPTRRSQGQGGRGAAHLVGDHGQGFAGLRLEAMQAQHGEAKVFAHGPIDPTGAQDAAAVVGHGLAGPLFAQGLAAAVNPKRIHRLIGSVGRALTTVEDEVGAHLEQAAAGFGQGPGEGLRGPSVDRLGQLRFGFGLINGGVGAPIENPIGPQIQDGLTAGRGVGQVQLAAPHGDEFDVGWHALAQGLAQLTIGAGQQNPFGAHGKTSPRLANSARVGASASLAARQASWPPRRSRGHWRPRAGSFHSRERSQSLLQKWLAL